MKSAKARIKTLRHLLAGEPRETNHTPPAVFTTQSSFGTHGHKKTSYIIIVLQRGRIQEVDHSIEPQQTRQANEVTAKDVRIRLNDQNVQRLKRLTADDPPRDASNENLHRLGGERTDDDLCPQDARQQSN